MLQKEKKNTKVKQEELVNPPKLQVYTKLADSEH